MAMGISWSVTSAPPLGTHHDPLSRMRTYQLASSLVLEAWSDAEVLQQHVVTERIGAQLYAAIASITANLSEGYSRSSGRDRARMFEYALGSVRESIAWYAASGQALSIETVDDRLEKLTEIRRLLLAIIPRERNRLIRPTRQRGSKPVRSPQ